MQKSKTLIIIFTSIFWILLYLTLKWVWEGNYIPFRPMVSDTRGLGAEYVYIDEPIIDREMKSRYALGFIYYEVPVKFDRYHQLIIPRSLYDNEVFMANFTSRMNDSLFVAKTLFIHPDSIYRKIE